MASQAFEDNIYKNGRRTVAEVSYSLVAPEAKEIGVAYLPEGNSFSRPEQIMNEISNISTKIATFEPNHWKLDGSFALPLPPEQSNMEVGWWGKGLSDSEGILNPIPQIEILFPVVQNIKRFGITFDEPTNNYCTDLEFIVYDSSFNVILNERITNNTSVSPHTREGVQNAYIVVIKLYKTNNPFRFPRVSELDFGILIRFANDDIFSLNLVTEANPTGASFPFSSLSLSVANNDRFDQLDPTSYAQYLYARQSFEYRHGLVLPDGSTEWAYMGAYYLQDWKVSDSQVTFTAGGKTSLLENYTFFNSSLAEFTIGQLIRDVLDTVGIDYYLAPELDFSPLVTGWFGEKSYREVLANLTELSCCLAYENQQNTVEFTDILKPLGNVTKLDYNNMFSAPEPKLQTYYNGINLTEYTITQTSPEVRLEGKEVFYSAPWRDPLEPDYPYSVDLPCMVITPNFPTFRSWFLERKFALIRKRISVDVSWLQNPALQVGDGANVQITRKGGTLDMAITKQTIDYNTGILRGSTQAVGDSIL